MNEDAVRWLGSPHRAADGPFDVVVVDPPYDRPELLVAALDGPRAAPGAGRRGSWPSTAGATPPPPRIGLLASERERRFGETALTFYRREEDR